MVAGAPIWLPPVAAVQPDEQGRARRHFWRTVLPKDVHKRLGRRTRQDMSQRAAAQELSPQVAVTSRLPKLPGICCCRKCPET